MEKTLKLLPNDQHRILKSIKIFVEKNGYNHHYGTVMYKRHLTSSYNLVKQREEDERTNATLLDKLLNEHPRQENYPSDEIDFIILSAVQNEFPKSQLRNDLILFNTHLDKINLVKRQMAVQSKLVVTPSFNTYEEIKQMVGASFLRLELNFTIFMPSKNDVLDNYSFYGKYYYKDLAIVEEMESLEMESLEFE